MSVGRGERSRLLRRDRTEKNVHKEDPCPVCGRVPVLRYRDETRKKRVYKHSKSTKGAYGTIITQTVYCEAER